MGRCTVTKELGVKTTNTTGQLAKVTGPIAEAKVNITALTATATGNDAWIWLVTDNTTKAKEALTKSGWQVTERDCCCLELTDKPGTCFEATTKLATAGINLERWYFSSTGGPTATVYFTCDNCQKATTLW